MKIAIIGAGNVGSALGKRLVNIGNTVVYGVRKPHDPKYNTLLNILGKKASMHTISDAVKDAEIVILAMPWSSAEDAIRDAGNLVGKIVVDCTNPLKPDLTGLSLGLNTSAAEQIAIWAKGAKVCKSFNHTGYKNMENPEFINGRAAMFVCGDDQDARKKIVKLANQMGFDAHDAGELNVARLLEPLAMLWIDLAIKSGMGTDFAFGLLRR